MKRILRARWFYAILAVIILEIILSADTIKRSSSLYQPNSLLYTEIYYWQPADQRLVGSLLVMVKIVLLSIFFVSLVQEEIADAYPYIARRTNFVRYFSGSILFYVSTIILIVAALVILLSSVLRVHQDYLILFTCSDLLLLVGISSLSILFIPFFSKPIAVFIPLLLFIGAVGFPMPDSFDRWRFFDRQEDGLSYDAVKYFGPKLFQFLKAMVFLVLAASLTPKFVRYKNVHG